MCSTFSPFATTLTIARNSRPLKLWNKETLHETDINVNHDIIISKESFIKGKESI